MRVRVQGPSSLVVYLFRDTKKSMRVKKRKKGTRGKRSWLKREIKENERLIVSCERLYSENVKPRREEEEEEEDKEEDERGEEEE